MRRICDLCWYIVATASVLGIIVLCIVGIIYPRQEPQATVKSAPAEVVQTEPEQTPPISMRYVEATITEPVDTHPEVVEACTEPEEPELVLLDTFIATAYCQTGTTATGTYTTPGRTLAVNPKIIPYGTHVWIYLDDGTLVGDYYAEDTGSNMQAHPYVVDIYMGEDSYDQCMQWGAQHVSVYVEAD